MVEIREEAVRLLVNLALCKANQEAMCRVPRLVTFVVELVRNDSPATPLARASALDVLLALSSVAPNHVILLQTPGLMEALVATTNLRVALRVFHNFCAGGGAAVKARMAHFPGFLEALVNGMKTTPARTARDNDLVGCAARVAMMLSLETRSEIASLGSRPSPRLFSRWPLACISSVLTAARVMS